MSIDKGSSGLPEVHPGKKTTQVNLSVIAGVVLFLVVMGSILWYFASRAPDHVNAPSPPLTPSQAPAPATEQSPSKK